MTALACNRGDMPVRGDSDGPVCDDRVDVLVLVAFGPELAPLQPAFAAAFASAAGPANERAPAPAGGMKGPLGPRSLWVQAHTCGIGLSAAAANSSFHIGETRPRAVVLLGTCGAYKGVASAVHSELGVGDVVVSQRIVLVDWATIEGHAQFPPGMAEPIS